MKGTLEGIHVIKPLVGDKLKEVLKLIASESLSPTQGLKLFNESMNQFFLPTKKMDKFRKIIVDPYYYGAVEMDKQVKIRNENGLHEALITKAEHEAIVHAMLGKPKNQNGPRKGGNPLYPASRMVTCANCSKSISKYNLYQARVSHFKPVAGQPALAGWPV
jgi:hypothetical protein